MLSPFYSNWNTCLFSQLGFCSALLGRIIFHGNLIVKGSYAVVILLLQIKYIQKLFQFLLLWFPLKCKLLIIRYIYVYIFKSKQLIYFWAYWTGRLLTYPGILLFSLRELILMSVIPDRWIGIIISIDREAKTNIRSEVAQCRIMTASTGFRSCYCSSVLKIKLFVLTVLQRYTCFVMSFVLLKNHMKVTKVIPEIMYFSTSESSWCKYNNYINIRRASIKQIL